MTQKNGCEEGRLKNDYIFYLVGATLLLLAYVPEYIFLGHYVAVEGIQKTIANFHLNQVSIVREMFLVMVGVSVYAAEKRRSEVSICFMLGALVLFVVIMYIYIKMWCKG